MLLNSGFPELVDIYNNIPDYEGDNLDTMVRYREMKRSLNEEYYTIDDEINEYFFQRTIDNWGKGDNL